MKKLAFLLCFLGLLVSCTSKSQVGGFKTDPYYDSFFEKVRLIMSDEEIQIYKHLPDQEARARFVEEFWAKRDPTPETEENEIRNEFYERIEYANKWFNEARSKERGWDTERGRILLQIGFPEERQWGELPDSNIDGRLITTKRIPLERWFYYRYQMVLTFIGDMQGFSTFKLYRVPTQLRTVLDMAKSQLDIGAKKPVKNAFKFEVEFKKGKIKITIPVKRISFEELEGTMKADFLVQVYVYRDYEKIDEINEEKSISRKKEELLNLKNVDFMIPYPPPTKGAYYFDIIIMDKSSGVKYRTFFNFKH